MSRSKLRPIRAYVAAVIAAGLGLLGFLLITRVSELDFSAPTFWIFTVAVIIGELVPIQVPRQNEVFYVTVSGTFAFAVLLTHGIPGALLALASACIIDDVRQRKPLWKTAFNVGQYVLAIAASGWILEASSDLPTSVQNLDFNGQNILAISLAATAFFIVNYGLSAVAQALAANMPLSRGFIGNIGLEAATDWLLLALSPIVIAVANQSLILLPLLAIPIGAAYKSAKVSIHNLELANDLRVQAEENKHLALHDPLTNLPNRTLFQERVHQEILNARRRGEALAVLLMDLDRFKEINDALGHHNGDRLLIEIGRRLRGIVRESDTVARLGGDEFAILLPGLEAAENALYAVNNLLEAFERPFFIEELTLKVEASIGIAFHPEHGTDPGTLLRHADVAMYGAKESRTGYELYQSEKDEHTRDRLAMVEQLREAIERGDFVLHYQPKVSLRTGRPTGVEALIRWYHEGALIPPDVFIPLAEHTGLIRPLTQWVVEAAARQCREWDQAGVDLNIAVNLSMRNLFDLELADHMSAILRKWNVPPSRLELEITESGIAADPVRAAKVLEELARMGFTLSIDDFGTGHSSLSRLRHLPVNELKIDRSFVMDMASQEDDTAIVRSIIDLGRNLGLRVVAEGVEQPETLGRLKALGCDVAQGFCLSRPISATELTKWHQSFEGSPTALSLVTEIPPAPL
jgi:diguanylate cyclase (GGDEF)-like protein